MVSDHTKTRFGRRRPYLLFGALPLSIGFALLWQVFFKDMNQMPGNDGYNDVKIVAAVKNKSLLEEDLDKVALRVTELILKGIQNKINGYHYDKEIHHKLAIEAAEQSAVLLKNNDRILPGNLKQKAAVIGGFAKVPRYQGAGSSKLHPIKIESAWDSFRNIIQVNICYIYTLLLNR